MGRLDGKVAIITGAAQGIGREYALRFAQEGATVAVADIRAEQAAGTVEAITDAGGRAMAVTVDIADEAATRRCVEEVVGAHSRVDVLVNNAGLYYDLEISDTSFAYFKRVMEVNLYGSMLMTAAVFPVMRDQGGGSIINQASTAAYIYNIAAQKEFGAGGINREAPLSFPHYSLSKASLIAATKFIAGDIGVFGIRVNCIAPGVTMTEATKRIVPENMTGMLTMFTALRKTLDPADLAGTAVFLASDESALMTGQTLVVDAGQFMLG